MSVLRRAAHDRRGQTGLALLCYVMAVSIAALAGANLDSPHSVTQALLSAARFPALYLGLILTHTVRYEVRTPQWIAGIIATVAMGELAAEQLTRQLGHTALAHTLHGLSSVAIGIFLVSATTLVLIPARPRRSLT